MKKLLLSLSIIFCVSIVSCSKADVAATPEEVQPLEVGQSIPDVTLQDPSGNDVDLIDQVADKPTLLIFYRGGWCPFCNSHLSQLVEIEDSLYNMGVQILAISPDQPSYLQESSEENALGYQLLSDSEMIASKAFGLAFRVDTATVNRYKRNGLDLADRSGNDHYLLPVPAAFLADTNAVIRFRYFNPDYTVRIENQEILNAIEESIR